MDGLVPDKNHHRQVINSPIDGVLGCLLVGRQSGDKLIMTLKQLGTRKSDKEDHQEGEEEEGDSQQGATIPVHS